MTMQTVAKNVPIPPIFFKPAKQQLCLVLDIIRILVLYREN